jgi:hypothetical protein
MGRGSIIQQLLEHRLGSRTSLPVTLSPALLIDGHNVLEAEASNDLCDSRNYCRFAEKVPVAP